MAERRWLFGDQLGPHFLDTPRQSVLLIESKGVFRRRRFHRRKAHLVLSAMRHRAEELGKRALYLKTETYAEALEQVGDELTVCAPTTYAARRFVESRGIEQLDARGWAVTQSQFAHWAKGRNNLVMEDFYREVRKHHGVLMDADRPAGGVWNLDHDNREAPPKSDTLEVPEPWWPEEDDIDQEVREDLDRWAAEGIEFLGEDGPRRFAVTRAEAEKALESFVQKRLEQFGPYEDAMLTNDRWMAHSLLSVPLNLGLLHPLEVAERAERAYREKKAPLNSVEGLVRQVIGWRDYVWHCYWHFGDDYRHRNGLRATKKLPTWLTELDAQDKVQAACLKSTLRSVREEGWAHHIPRLMVLGNWALQRGYDPAAMTDWYHRAFVDGYDWVMTPNVVGMALHADGGDMMTKPYAAGGAYINKMSDHCGDCVYDPKKRLGEKACPFTAGYWEFLDRNRDHFQHNHRMSRTLAGLARLKDREAVVDEVRKHGSKAP